MFHTPIAPPQPLFQLLITACSTFGAPSERCAWLHGFCLLTLKSTGSPVIAQAMVATAERYSDDRPLIKELTSLLEPQATLVGLDLTSTVSRLGRLSIDAADQAPTLTLLAQVEAMIANSAPVDLAMSAKTRDCVVRHARQQQLGIANRFEERGAGALFGVLDNGNPAALTLMMAETADACALALAEMKWGKPQQAALLLERVRWREKLLSTLS